MDIISLLGSMNSSLDIMKEFFKLKNNGMQTFSNQDKEVFINYKTTAFSKIEIIKYKKLINLKIEKLNRINIFAGLNNSGKTSLLEAIELLINQNDIYNFLEMQKRRAKFINLNPLWLNREFQDSIELKGVFNNTSTFVKIDKIREEDENLNKEEPYLSTIQINSNFAEKNLISQNRLFQTKDEKIYKNIKIICNNSYSTPFAIQNRTDLEKLYSKSVDRDVFIDILDFIKENIDKDIKDIRFTKEHIETFKVNHKDFTADLSNFGEGLQRIFYIALQFASAENGVLLIDELENGIHYTLLEKFTEFIQKLADKLNVQVFLTTHSKECIEAFVNNGYKNEDVSYNLIAQTLDGKEIKVINYTSESLLNKLSQNLEIRGW